MDGKKRVRDTGAEKTIFILLVVGGFLALLVLDGFDMRKASLGILASVPAVLLLYNFLWESDSARNILLAVLALTLVFAPVITAYNAQSHYENLRESFRDLSVFLPSGFFVVSSTIGLMFAVLLLIASDTRFVKRSGANIGSELLQRAAQVFSAALLIILLVMVFFVLRLG